ncbi:hypothetical protein Kisp01_71810 [Kineosporia sp. NBRC 101677]|uniref:hypothetical protein n=1 Tax=Kineosporia sp. NBRC 101677 TaxID=3032197 RepID=UPI0024A4D055|nr:hypothetical protein [Kineosporia sp. NBRC 101677]GLY20167.1 hypothetical protein Kisp01_71810 [Kineosporia sp. NBRC 101677]
MAVAQTFQKNDAGLRALNQALDTQVEHMRASNQAVGQLIDEVNRDFQADASTTWQNKVGEWQQNYQQVTRLVREVTDRLLVADGAINAAHDEAMQMGSSMDSGPAGDAVFNALNNS